MARVAFAHGGLARSSGFVLGGPIARVLVYSALAWVTGEDRGHPKILKP